MKKLLFFVCVAFCFTQSITTLSQQGRSLLLANKDRLRAIVNDLQKLAGQSAPSLVDQKNNYRDLVAEASDVVDELRLRAGFHDSIQVLFDKILAAQQQIDKKIAEVETERQRKFNRIKADIELKLDLFEKAQDFWQLRQVFQELKQDLKLATLAPWLREKVESEIVDELILDAFVARAQVLREMILQALVPKVKTKIIETAQALEQANQLTELNEHMRAFLLWLNEQGIERKEEKPGWFDRLDRNFFEDERDRPFSMLRQQYKKKKKQLQKKILQERVETIEW